MPRVSAPPRALCVTIQDLLRAAEFLGRMEDPDAITNETVWKLARVYARTHYMNVEHELHREQRRIQIISIEELLQNIHPRTFQWRRPAALPRVWSQNNPSL